MRFWDSSAMMPLLLEEPQSPMIRALAVADGSIAAWWGSPVECCSAVGRLRREGRITVREEDEIRRAVEALAGCWTEIEPTLELRGTASRILLNHPLRAADALQLAAALAWSGGSGTGQEFVSLDDRLRLAARNEGFLVLPDASEG